MAGQLSLIEFLAVVAPGSAVGAPVFYPDVPFKRGLTYSVHSVERIDTFVEGTPMVLVDDGEVVPSG